MESLVEGSNVNLHNRKSKEGGKNAPNSVEEGEADDIRYHWIVVLKGACFFLWNIMEFSQKVVSASNVKHCEESNSECNCSNKC